MRRFLIIAAIAAAGSACIVEREVVREPRVTAPPPPPAADTQSESAYQTEAPPPPAGSEIADDDVFYTGLAPYGSWTFVAPYGRVWIPSVAYGWRPYFYGRWVLTDWGWTFVSDDPWGWAAYHYGRWNWGIGLGWYWIPGRIWGPAWVSWRWGHGYAAWCPLGPNGIIFGYRHPAWVAVPEQHFTRPIRSVALPMRATAGVVTSTQPLVGPHAIPTGRNGSFGPPVAGVQRAVGQPIPRVPASQVIARPRAAGNAPPARVEGGPSMRSPARPAPRPYSGPGEIARPRPYGGSPERGVTPRSGGQGGVQGAPRSGSGKGAPAAPAPKAGGKPHASGKTK